MKKNKVAVIYGSDSSEWEVSCRSGEFTSSRIDGTRYDVFEIFARFGKWTLVSYRMKNSMRVIFPEDERPQIDKTDFSVVIDGKKINFDYAYIMQHGTPGENGLMQGYLEMLGIPFSSCSAFVSAMTFDKFSCKNYLRNVDFVKCADDVFIRRGDDVAGMADKVIGKLGLPLFVKPTDGGSSFGVVKVKKAEDFESAVEQAFAEGKTVLAERFIPGRELTDAVYFNGKELVALPVIEIVTKNEFFDYDAKYLGESNEVCPAEIPETLSEKVREMTAFIYNYLGCKGLVRMDYILNGEDIYFLEINTVPGMTPMSLVPGQVRAAGIDLQQFFTTLIEESL